MTVAEFRTLMSRFAEPLWNSTRDLLPIIGTVGVFQLFVFQQPLENVGQMVSGLVLVIAGLALFVVGLEVGLFPVGAQLAHDFAKKGSVRWLIAFAFALGIGTTFAEPALIAVAGKAAELAVVDHSSVAHDAMLQSYAFTLRITVAIAVGCALVAGVLRIILGWPLHYFIMSGYILVMLLTPFAPRTIIGVAYDSGGVTTSTITVPLTTALGVGLASSIKGRSALLDGFGLIAFASLTPIIFVLLMGILWS